MGTFLAALVLIPHVGTQRTFLILAAIPALAASLALDRRALLVPAALLAALALPVGTVKPAETGRVLYETETPYQYARVVQMPDGSRRLELNEGQAIHSLWKPGTVLTGAYWDGYLVLPFTVSPRPPARIAVLGTAGGTVARAYAHYFPDTRMTRSTSTASCSRSGAAGSGCRRGRNCASTPRTRGRSCAGRPSATTRSSSTPTASPTSRFTSPPRSSSRSRASGCGPADR